MKSCLIVCLCVVGIASLLAGPAAAQIVINEIMYNSLGSPDVEWIELYNSSTVAIDLTDWYLLDDNPGHLPCLLVGTLDVGEYLVVAADLTAFAAQYPGVTNVNANDFDPGGAGWGLGNSGDSVLLYDATTMLHDAVDYNDTAPWPTAPDGSGPSLELVNPYLDNSLATSWAASTVDWGTPGTLNSTFVDDQPPVIDYVERDIDFPAADTAVQITAQTHDQEDLELVELLVDTGTGFAAQFMFDDGAHGDGDPLDGVFGAAIAPQVEGTLVRYYVRSTDDLGQPTTWPAGAPAQYLAYTAGYQPPAGLRINEVLASNQTGITDEMGQFEDWVEIYNGGTEAVDLTGMYLTDDFDEPRLWPLPALVLGVDEYLIIWADDEPAQGSLHATFKLSGAGEEIGLYTSIDHGNARASGFKFGVQRHDISWGWWDPPVRGSGRSSTRNPGQNAPEYLAVPTPGVDNQTSTLFSSVVINEFLTTSNNGGVDDWIEIYNRGTETANLTGWFLTDARSLPTRWEFPLNTFLAPGEFLVVDEIELGFGFASSGGIVMLSSVGGTVGQDFYDFGPQMPDVSEGRYTDGLSFWTSMTAMSPGAPNQALDSVPGGDPVPAALRALGVVPNPFNPLAAIHFAAPTAGEVVVAVHGLDGRLVRTLTAGVSQPGPHSVVWDGRDGAGRQVASGSYFARIQLADEVVTQKMLLLK